MSTRIWHEVVLTAEANKTACRHLLQHYDAGTVQEDLCFGLWTLSKGADRETAIVTKIILPERKDRDLHGNASFSGQYLARATREALRSGQGLTFMHSHSSNGWQDMSVPDIRAERDRIAYTAGATGFPLVGMTVGTDGHWSARVWIDDARHSSLKVRVVEKSRLIVWLQPSVEERDRTKQRRTVESWGEDKQRIIEAIRVGVVGLGSVGSIVAEGLARIGVRDLVLIDHDVVEKHNLDRLLNAGVKDIGRPKTDVAEAAVRRSASAKKIEILNIRRKIQDTMAWAAARDCDILMCCVDTPVARDVLNRIALRDGIPVVDGGVEIRTAPSTGNMSAARWKVHIVNPYNQCLRCNGQYSSSDIILELDGSLDNPTYINGHEAGTRRGENVFNASLAAASEALNMAIRMVIADAWWPMHAGIERNLVTGRTKIRHGSCCESCTISQECWTGDSAPMLPYLEAENSRINWLSKLVRRLGASFHAQRRWQHGS